MLLTEQITKRRCFLTVIFHLHGVYPIKTLLKAENQSIEISLTA